MNRTILIFLLSTVTAFATAGQPPVATEATTDKGSLINMAYDAAMLTRNLALYPEVQKSDFYYLKVFPKAHVQGTATLSTGQSVAWFHYECGGLYLRYPDGSERYFLHPISVEKLKESKSRRSKSADPK